MYSGNWLRNAWVAAVASVVSCAVHAQTALVNGGSISAAIGAAGEQDVYSFSAQPGESVQIRVADTSGGELQPAVVVRSPSGVLIASAVGFDVDVLGGCPTPEGMFRCGYVFCEQGFEYCRHVMSNIEGQPDHYSCHEPDSECDPLDCGCLTSDVCLEIGNCEANEDGDLVVTCAGI